MFPAMKFIFLCCLSIFLPTLIFAQNNSSGTITGTITDESTGSPLPFVNVAVHSAADSSIVTGAATDRDGKVKIVNVPSGKYFAQYGLIGYQSKSSIAFIIDASHLHCNLGTVALTATTINLNEVVVSGEKSLLTTAIDRKVYNVDQDLLGKSGSASELLQNVPSIQVDIDGNVSLRGSGNILFMVNGRNSPMLNKNSAEVLQQMPANSIEKIEVITNPSAKYNPEGTAGIINIVQKKNTSLGINGNVTANAGNMDRYNGGIRLNFNPGDLNIYGNWNVRRDNRNRTNYDNRRQTDTSQTVTFVNDTLNSFARPMMNMGSVGFDYRLSQGDQIGASGSYFHNGFTRSDFSSMHTDDAAGNPQSMYNRDRHDDAYEQEWETQSYLEHEFAGNDNKIRLEYNYSTSSEQEDNHYTNYYAVPAIAPSFDNTLIGNNERRNHLALEYSVPFGESTSFEAGYAGEFNTTDLNYRGEAFDPAQQAFVVDGQKTNHFIYDGSINAAYVTLKKSFGAFGFLAGLRGETVAIQSSLVTLDSVVSNDYRSIYPSLHLSYTLSPLLELRLSYSKRTHRPEGDDLNPFPEYQDPRNVQSGNPKLLPEYIHSVEFGCQVQTEYFTVLPSLYYRYTYNRFTSVTQFLNDTTLLTTRQNLSNDQSGGIEVVFSADIKDWVSAHWSINGFNSQIDASNLGYTSSKSITTWGSSLTLNVTLAKGSRLQVNSNYNSARLTPQGEFNPSGVVNAGFRQEFMDGKIAMVLTMADIFKTQKRELRLDVPPLMQTVTNTRDSRIVFLGLTYRFGAAPKKDKEDQLKYDDSL
jgi:outer membrane receptor protein involved in Fe transport